MHFLLFSFVFFILVLSSDMQDKIVKHSPLPWWISFYQSFALALTGTGAMMIMTPQPTKFRNCVAGVFFLWYLDCPNCARREKIWRKIIIRRYTNFQILEIIIKKKQIRINAEFRVKLSSFFCARRCVLFIRNRFVSIRRAEVFRVSTRNIAESSRQAVSMVFFLEETPYPRRPLKNAKPSGKKWIKGIPGNRPYILEFQNVELPRIKPRKRVYSGTAQWTLKKNRKFSLLIFDRFGVKNEVLMTRSALKWERDKEEKNIFIWERERSNL